MANNGGASIAERFLQLGFSKSDPALNKILVRGIENPGRAMVVGASRPYRWDIKEGYGVEGAATVYHGRGRAKFTVYIDIWDTAHFQAWPNFMLLFEPPSLGFPLVLEMGHPFLSQIGVKSVCIESVSALERQQNGLWRCTIQCLEYMPPKPAPPIKPRGAIPAVAKGKPIPAKTEADLAIDEALAALEASRDAARR